MRPRSKRLYARCILLMAVGCLMIWFLDSRAARVAPLLSWRDLSSSISVLSVKSRTLPRPPSSPNDLFPWCYPSASSTTAAVVEKMAATRRFVLDLYHKSKQARKLGNSTQRHEPHQVTPLEPLMSEFSLSELLPETDTTFVMSCSHFEPYCEGMDQDSLEKIFDQLYQPPDFPALADTLEIYNIKAALWPLVAALNASSADGDEVRLFRRGKRTVPPEVAIIFDGWIGETGSLLSDDVFYPSFLGAESAEEFRMQYMRPDVFENVRKVKEVAVISHSHHGMYWHFMVSEYFRIFSMLPFLQANEDIYIHLGVNEQQPTFAHLYRLLNISGDRLIFGEAVKADVIYFTQPIHRNEVPPLGLTQLIRQRLWDSIVHPQPGWQSWSALGFAGDAWPTRKGVEINILSIVRSDPARGRMILNYNELIAELRKLGQEYAKKRNVSINLIEHLPSMSITEFLPLYSRADIVIGAHGAGLANLFAVRPGAHVIELVVARELNLYSSARLGLRYHGVVAPLLLNGTVVPPDVHAHEVNFQPDIKQLVSLVRAILIARFP